MANNFEAAAFALQCAFPKNKIFKVTKSKLEAYMEKKSKETATVARFGKAGEDNDKKLGD